MESGLAIHLIVGVFSFVNENIGYTHFDNNSYGFLKQLMVV